MPHPKFSAGDRVEIIDPRTHRVEKIGVVKCLRKDSDSDDGEHHHPKPVFYYKVKSLDSSLITEESELCMRKPGTLSTVEEMQAAKEAKAHQQIDSTHKLKLSSYPTPAPHFFQPGQRVAVLDTQFQLRKTGQVERMRNDQFEQTKRHPEGLFRYHVSFDDGTRDDYQAAECMRNIQ